MIDYTNEFDEYDVDMPVFRIITDDNNLIRRIRIDDLVSDLHKTFLFPLIDGLILMPLVKTDQEFANFLKKLKITEKGKEKDFSFLIVQSMI